VHIRQSVCQEITISDYFFHKRNENPVDIDAVRETLRVTYRDVFHMIYKKRQSYLRRGFKYKNPYRARWFKVSGFVCGEYRQNITVREQVFVCLTSGNHADVIFPYYVSKAYNVNSEMNSSTKCITGRFIFSYYTDKLVALAEEPSQAFIRPDFNVELYYLEKRKHHQPGEN